MCFATEPRELTLDHIVCRSRGGNNSERNLVTACRSCNSARGNTRLSDFAPLAVVRQINCVRRRKLDQYLALAKEIMKA
jgi:5-methylcytosine-specific restriction endonuclease McrA